MTRRCSHCNNNGHNSRTCSGRGGGGGSGGGVKLFGVRIAEGAGAMKRSASMGSLSSSSDPVQDHAAAASGYASDDPGHASCSSNCRNERKKGNPWTEEEHRMFLLGLQKLGKGDWRGIARNFVVSRSPTQVASHAQKYFIRQANASRRKRRSSLFDMVPQLSNPPPPPETKENILYNSTLLPVLPPIYPTLVQVKFPFWPTNLSIPVREEEMVENHEVYKPTPVLPKDPINADELVGMSKLCIREVGSGRMEPSALSIKLRETSASRQSAFHLHPSISRPDLNHRSSNVIHAV
ncbi:Transcription factor MYB1R1 [Apostasia shenzhenica]|uniref:Transcription factor MYB1R1 n=1 Tax=Apostasia shenzhenica TaxID=1088818 RepID=A0A2H9ZU63_9ASPA|nr:Transcription factor MYB1R1 [Apostasia shenzhenica]